MAEYTPFQFVIRAFEQAIVEARKNGAKVVIPKELAESVLNMIHAYDDEMERKKEEAIDHINQCEHNIRIGQPRERYFF